MKGSWLAGRDGEVSSGGWWGRGLVHLSSKVDVVAEMNDFFRGTAAARYLTWGANYYFPWGLTRLKFNHRYFFEPASVSEFKLQLQIFLEEKWRSQRPQQGALNILSDDGLYFSPRGEAKWVRGPSGRGASRLARAGVLEQYVEHGKQAQRSPGGRIACFDRQVLRNAG